MRFMHAPDVRRWLITVPPNGCLMVFDETEIDLVEGIVEGLLDVVDDDESKDFLNRILASVTARGDLN